MRVPEGITEIYVEREGRTNYRSRLEGHRLIIRIFNQHKETETNGTSYKDKPNDIR